MGFRRSRGEEDGGAMWDRWSVGGRVVPLDCTALVELLPLEFLKVRQPGIAWRVVANSH